MAVAVVDVLEVIEVEEQQRERSSEWRARELGAQPREDRAPIQNAGQQIVLGELVRDVALMAERQRLVGEHEREHQVRKRERRRQREFKPDRQRPLHA